MSLDKVLDDREKKIEVAGEEMVIRPITIGVLPKVLGGLGILQKLLTSGMGAMDELIENWDKLVGMLSAVTQKDEKFISNLNPVEAMTILEALYEVNQDGFFLMMEKAEKMGKKSTPKKTGRTRSKPSSPQDTALNL